MAAKSTVKVTRHRQVTIPAHIARTVGIREGDMLSVESEDERIVLRKSTHELPRFRLGRKITEEEIERMIEESIAEIAG